MREMHLTPDLWVVSARQIFLPKIAAWKEEIHCWKQEATQLQRIVIFGAIRNEKLNKELLASIEQQLTQFTSEQIPKIEQQLRELERVLERKALGSQFRKVEAQIEQMRKIYYELKMQLLPFLAKFISAPIW